MIFTNFPKASLMKNTNKENNITVPEIDIITDLKLKKDLKDNIRVTVPPLETKDDPVNS